uniref:KRAB-related domain-containing protein n=1 Tax=Lynx canadensis TaxID=61383 RepID=A0A667ICR3_LYNCA
MNKGNSFAKRPKEVTQKSEKKCKEFEAISKFFSKEVWAKLGYSDKITYVYMKRNYDIMTGLGNRKFWVQTSLGTHHYPLSPFTCHDFFLGCKCPTPALCAGRNPRVMHKKPKEKDDSDPVPVALGSKQVQEQQRCPGKASAPGKKRSKKGKNIWANRLRQRKNLIAYEEISDPEEDD